MSISVEDFKKCMGSFTTGITIVTFIDAANELQGITINSFSSLSLEPFMVAFNLGKSSYLHSKILNSDCFAVNILAEGQEEICQRFANSSSHKWDGVKYEPGINGCPLLEGALAHIECHTGNIYEGGDHSIITGTIQKLKTFEDRNPLVYYRGEFRRF